MLVKRKKRIIFLFFVFIVIALACYRDNLSNLWIYFRYAYLDKYDLQEPISSLFEDDQASDLRLHLIYVPSPYPDHNSIRLKLRLFNAGDTPIIVDPRSLAPWEVTYFADSTGKRLGGVSPPIPKPVIRSELLSLQPGQFYDCWLMPTMGLVPSIESALPPFSAQCCYQTDHINYEKKYQKNWNVWRGTVYSNIVYFETKNESNFVHCLP